MNNFALNRHLKLTVFIILMFSIDAFASATIALETTNFLEAAQETDAEVIEDVGLVFAYIFFPILFVLHMLLLIGYIKRSMYASSKKVASDGDFNEDQAELPAKEQPTCVYYDMGTQTESQSENREELIKTLLKGKRRMRRLILTTCIMYLILPLGLQYIFNGPRTDVHVEVFPFVLFYFIFMLVCLMMNGKSRYRATGRSFGFMVPQLRWIRDALRTFTSSLGFIMISLLLIGILFYQGVEVVAPKSEAALLLETQNQKEKLFPIGWEDEKLNRQDYTELLSKPDMGFGIGLFLACTLHLFLLLGLWQKKQHGPNMKLLVLRVFGPSKGSVFTFNRLIRFWRFFGTYMTVDDPNFARHRHRFFQFKTLTIFMVLVLTHAVWQLQMALFVSVFISDWYTVLKRGPARDRAHIEHRIQKVLEKPRPIGLKFKDLRMVAYMNTWKMTVAEFVKVADVILMDLRDFDKNREGCKYEVDYIMDSFPINRIVFLMHGKSDSEAITELLFERWAELKVGSPNENIKNPKLQLYVSSNEKGDDVQSLMDLLLSISHSPKK